VRDKLITALVVSLVILANPAYVMAAQLPASQTYSVAMRSQNQQAVVMDQLASVDPSTVLRVPEDFADLQDAITAVVDGGVIELAGGVYSTPSDGFVIHNLGKGFTIQAAPNAVVTIDGGGSRELFRYQNTDFWRGGPVTFKGLIFANGYTNTEGLAGGLTLYKAEATFIDCEFRNNRAVVNTTVGGAVYVADGSEVFFFDTRWYNNSSRFGGGALGIRADSKVYMHYSEFENNHANPENHLVGASGGAVNIGNSVVRISDTRFEGNEAGAYGGALYAIGNWQSPVTQPRADVVLANVVFLNNHAKRHTSVNASFPTEGGAINIEDQTLLRIYRSRLALNSANIGGGLNIYRARAEVYHSVLQGNVANGTVYTAAFGGAVSLNSADLPSDGGSNRPNASVLIQDTLIQGRYEGVGTVAQTSGGIHAGGDLSRMDGDGSVPDMGSPADNRAQVVLRRATIYDCDVSAIQPNASLGGALEVSLTDITIEDSLILESDAYGDMAAAGGLAILNNSVARISGTTIAHNSAAMFGGGVFVQGSQIELRDSNLLDNTVSPGTSQSVWSSYGAALMLMPDSSRGYWTTGVVERNVFSENNGMAIHESDSDYGPVSAVVFNANKFYESSYGDHVYYSYLVEEKSVSELNALVVSRKSGSVTDKSTQDNIALQSVPSVAGVLASPKSPVAYGVSATDTQAELPPAYVAYSWSGQSAVLDSTPLNSSVGLVEVGNVSNSYPLVVDGVEYEAVVESVEPPDGTFELQSSDGETVQLGWHVTGGELLDLTIDQGLDVTPSSQGTASAPAGVARVYYLYAITDRGGFLAELSTAVPVLSMSSSVYKIAQVGSGVKLVTVLVRNGGGSVMEWTAATDTPSLVNVLTKSGVTETSSPLSFEIDASGRPVGTYTAVVNIDAGDAGSHSLPVTVQVVEKVYETFIPLASRD
jgi:hypothetical protein